MVVVVLSYLSPASCRAVTAALGWPLRRRGAARVGGRAAASAAAGNDGAEEAEEDGEEEDDDLWGSHIERACAHAAMLERTQTRLLDTMVEVCARACVWASERESKSENTHADAPAERYGGGSRACMCVRARVGERVRAAGTHRHAASPPTRRRRPTPPATRTSPARSQVEAGVARREAPALDLAAHCIVSCRNATEYTFNAAAQQARRAGLLLLAG